MNHSNQIMEAVPNFSEGRNLNIIDKLLTPLRSTEGVRLLDYSRDEDHNRMVATMAGHPDALRQAITDAVGIAIACIDLNRHRGEHPRIGAVDVIPFIPLRGYDMEAAVRLARETAAGIASRYPQLPVILYEEAATAPHRRNLADLRRGEFEGLDAKLQRPEWQPDYGPARRHPTAGAVAVGARRPLIAFNVNLGTTDIRIAKEIASSVRQSGGGLPACKALGIELRSKGMVQVSMNLTDYTLTGIHQAYEAVSREADKRGISVACCELIGMIPQEAAAHSLGHFLRISNFNSQQILI
ncbi:MAG: glutamate formimidoyltransferase [Tannerellaceae bacterium]|nr:glutamate formimidoyltransferase [Tannerellaceae bacterium]